MKTIAIKINISIRVILYSFKLLLFFFQVIKTFYEIELTGWDKSSQLYHNGAVTAHVLLKQLDKW